MAEAKPGFFKRIFSFALGKRPAPAEEPVAPMPEGTPAGEVAEAAHEVAVAEQRPEPAKVVGEPDLAKREPEPEARQVAQAPQVEVADEYRGTPSKASAERRAEAGKGSAIGAAGKAGASDQGAGETEGKEVPNRKIRTTSGPRQGAAKKVREDRGCRARNRGAAAGAGNGRAGADAGTHRSCRAAEPAAPRHRQDAHSRSQAENCCPATGRRDSRLVRAFAQGPGEIIAGAERQHRRRRRQAPARRRNLAGPRGRSDPCRPRHRNRDAHHRGAIGAALRPRCQRERSACRHGQRNRQGAGAGGDSARTRSRASPACHSRRRRQRHRQDNDDRQARRQIAHCRTFDPDGRRRHVPRRRNRAAEDLGRAHRFPSRRPPDRRRCLPGLAYDALRQAVAKATT